MGLKYVKGRYIFIISIYVNCNPVQVLFNAFGEKKSFFEKIN